MNKKDWKAYIERIEFIEQKITLGTFTHQEKDRIITNLCGFVKNSLQEYGKNKGWR